MRPRFTSSLRTTLAATLTSCAALLTLAHQARAEAQPAGGLTEVASASRAETFNNLLGWWSGSGRLGFRQGRYEEIKCRATYRWDDADPKLLQAIRCATPSGKVDISGEVLESGGILTGAWTEKTYEMTGTLAGNVTPGGFQVKLSGDDLHATMTVFVKDARQIVEIQFHEGALLGLSMILERG